MYSVTENNGRISVTKIRIDQTELNTIERAINMEQSKLTLAVSENLDEIGGAEKIDILAVDMGYGDAKFTGGNYYGILAIDKFTSAVSPYSTTDENKGLALSPYSVEYEDVNYYVGEQAILQSPDTIKDVTTYEQLQYFTPVLLQYIYRQLGLDKNNHPKVIVIGLSVAHMSESAAYKKTVEAQVKALNWDDTVVRLHPQGEGAKVCYDEYGLNFERNKIGTGRLKTPADSWLVCDVGFITLDVGYVVQGETSKSAIKGIEGEGIVQIAARVAKLIRDNPEIPTTKISSKEAKEVIKSGYHRARGRSYNLKQDVRAIKTEYLERLKKIMEERFGEILNKSDFCLLVGGGAYIFQGLLQDEVEFANKELLSLLRKETPTDPKQINNRNRQIAHAKGKLSMAKDEATFWRIPEVGAEYYNSVGYYALGRKWLEENPNT